MNANNFKIILNDYRKGTYISMIWKSESPEGFLKVSKGVVRLTNKEVLTSKNGTDYAIFRITKNHKHRVKSKYFLNGVEITKKEYEQHNKKYNISDYFAKHLDDIILIG